MRTYGLVVRAPGRFPRGAGSSPATFKFLYVFLNKYKSSKELGGNCWLCQTQTPLCHDVFLHFVSRYCIIHCFKSLVTTNTGSKEHFLISYCMIIWSTKVPNTAPVVSFVLSKHQMYWYLSYLLLLWTHWMHSYKSIYIALGLRSINRSSARRRYYKYNSSHLLVC